MLAEKGADRNPTPEANPQVGSRSFRRLKSNG